MPVAPATVAGAVPDRVRDPANVSGAATVAANCHAAGVTGAAPVLGKYSLVANELFTR